MDEQGIKIEYLIPNREVRERIENKFQKTTELMWFGPKSLKRFWAFLPIGCLLAFLFSKELYVIFISGLLFWILIPVISHFGLKKAVDNALGYVEMMNGKHADVKFSLEISSTLLSFSTGGIQVGINNQHSIVGSMGSKYYEIQVFKDKNKKPIEIISIPVAHVDEATLDRLRTILGNWKAISK